MFFEGGFNDGFEGSCKGTLKVCVLMTRSFGWSLLGRGRKGGRVMEKRFVIFCQVFFLFLMSFFSFLISFFFFKEWVFFQTGRGWVWCFSKERRCCGVLLRSFLL